MFFCLLTIFVLINSGSVNSGALERWRGGIPAIFSRPLALARPPPPPPTWLDRISNSFSNMAAGLFHAVGNFLPLRGIASLAADIGVPGAATLIQFLTPRTPSARRLTSSTEPRPLNHRSSQGRKPGSDGKGYSPFRPEIQSIIGAAHGERGCMLKLACLSGKRLSSLSGASAVAIMMAAATNMMPHGIRDPYTAMKNSVMYSDDCSQYTCTREREDLWRGNVQHFSSNIWR